MMQWMSLEKTGKAEGEHYYGGNVFYKWFAQYFEKMILMAKSKEGGQIGTV